MKNLSLTILLLLSTPWLSAMEVLPLAKTGPETKQKLDPDKLIVKQDTELTKEQVENLDIDRFHYTHLMLLSDKTAELFTTSFRSNNELYKRLGSEKKLEEQAPRLELEKQLKAVQEELKAAKEALEQTKNLQKLETEQNKRLQEQNKRLDELEKQNKGLQELEEQNKRLQEKINKKNKNENKSSVFGDFYEESYNKESYTVEPLRLLGALDESDIEVLTKAKEKLDAELLTDTKVVTPEIFDKKAEAALKKEVSEKFINETIKYRVNQAKEQFKSIQNVADLDNLKIQEGLAKQIEQLENEIDAIEKKLYAKNAQAETHKYDVAILEQLKKKVTLQAKLDALPELDKNKKLFWANVYKHFAARKKALEEAQKKTTQPETQTK